MPGLSKIQWRTIARQMGEGRLVPVVGELITNSLLFDRQQFVQQWSDFIDYPMGGSFSITRLAQFLSIVAGGNWAAKEEFIAFSKQHLLGQAKKERPDATKLDRDKISLRKMRLSELTAELGYDVLLDEDANPLLRLANLPIRIYITTSYHNYLEQALLEVGRRPRVEICYWNDELRASPSVEPGLNPLTRLKDILSKRFKTGELIDLTFDLNIEYEDLPGETRADKARELASYLERHDRLADLVALGRRQRPDISWAGVLGDDDMDDTSAQSAAGLPSVFEIDPTYRPSSEEPLVYHLLGLDSYPDSLVLTENDYLDFLVKITTDSKIFPPPIRKALNNSSLLLLGYHMQDWDFRVLFRYLSTRKRRIGDQLSVAIQLAPEKLGADQDIEIAEAERYLEGYFGTAGFMIYWGEPAKFAQELWTNCRDIV